MPGEVVDPAECEPDVLAAMRACLHEGGWRKLFSPLLTRATAPYSIRGLNEVVARANYVHSQLWSLSGSVAEGGGGPGALPPHSHQCVA
eukprot:9514757-Alexandrium_andersonii.AAC.1